MILDFSIKNFGSIKNEQTLSFAARASAGEDRYLIYPKLMNGDLLLHEGKPVQLLKLAILVGANASGKSTVLKALDFFRHSIFYTKQDKKDDLKFLPFLLDDDSRVFPTVFTIRFFHKGYLFEHKLEMNRHCVIKEVIHFSDYNTTGQRELLFERDTDQFNENTVLTKVNERVMLENQISQLDLDSLAYLTLWNESVLVSLDKVDLPIPELKLMREWYGDVLGEMFTSDHYTRKAGQRVIDLMEQIPESRDFIIRCLQQVDPHIQGIDLEIIASSQLSKNIAKMVASIDAVLAGRERVNPLREAAIVKEYENKPPLKWALMVYQLQGKTYSIPLEHSAAGLKRAFILAGLTYKMMQTPQVMLFDAFKLALQPESAARLLELLVENMQDSQMILTADSPEFLRIEALVAQRDLIWFTHRNERLETELYSLNEFADQLEAEASIYHCYEAGRFAGKP